MERWYVLDYNLFQTMLHKDFEEWEIYMMRDFDVILE